MVLSLVDIQNTAVIYGERPVELTPELVTNLETSVCSDISFSHWVHLSFNSFLI